MNGAWAIHATIIFWYYENANASGTPSLIGQVWCSIKQPAEEVGRKLLMLMPLLYPDRMRSLQLISSRRRMDRQIYFPSSDRWLPPPPPSPSLLFPWNSTERWKKRGSQRERRVDPWPNWTALKRENEAAAGEEQRHLHSFRWQCFRNLNLFY